jgi:branched-subunit amino acid aminotransferase/4-amino-4-deoxychorismate lyase
MEANIYCIEDHQLYTPSLVTGCITDTFRELTLTAAQAAGFKVIETEGLKPADLQKMNEIFTVSEKNGFSWILGIGIKRFVRKKTEKIREMAERVLWEKRLVAGR